MATGHPTEQQGPAAHPVKQGPVAHQEHQHRFHLVLLSKPPIQIAISSKSQLQEKQRFKLRSSDGLAEVEVGGNQSAAAQLRDSGGASTVEGVELPSVAKDGVER